MTVAVFLERVYTSASSSTLKDLWQNLDRNGEIFRHICTHEGVPEDGPLDFGHGFFVQGKGQVGQVPEDNANNNPDLCKRAYRLSGSGLEFTVLAEVEDTVESRTHGYASGVVVCGSEFSEHLSLDVFNSARIRIIFFGSLPEEPVHSVTDARGDVDIFEQGEIRQSDLEIMGHTVLEFVPETWFVEFGSLEIDPVLQ